MIDLPAHGYVQAQTRFIDPGGVVAGSLGGPMDVIDRPGLRYSLTFSLPLLRSSDDARIFQTLLEQGLRDDVSYPWPLDFKSLPAGRTPQVAATSPAGATIPLKGLWPGYQLRVGQPLAVISGGVGYVHKVSANVVAAADGTATVDVFPWTRVQFANNDAVEIERPRIRGALSWDGTVQGSFGKRGFDFTITERI